MVGILVGLQLQREDVGQVGTTGFLVDGTLVHVGGLAGLVHIGGKDMSDRKGGVQDLGGRLYQATVPAVPASPIQIQAVDVHAYRETVVAVNKKLLSSFTKQFKNHHVPKYTEDLKKEPFSDSHFETDSVRRNRGTNHYYFHYSEDVDTKIKLV